MEKTNPLHSIVPHKTNYSDSPGLTKREYFAALAMQGMCSYMPEFAQSHAEKISETAIQIADALIEALNKPEGV